MSEANPMPVPSNLVYQYPDHAPGANRKPELQDHLRYPPERVICGRKLLPPRGRQWTFTQEKIDSMEKENRIRIDESVSYTDLDGEVVDTKNLDWKRIKPLIWW